MQMPSRLYRRALDAGRVQGSASPLDAMAACWEALGDALQRTGELVPAADAFNAARSLSAGDPLAQARQLHTRMIDAHLWGELSASVRRGGAAVRALEHAEGKEARALRAQLLVELAFVRWRQGKFALSERLCRAAIEEATDRTAERALAQASYVLDFVLLDLGRLAEAVHSARALAIYEQLGDRESQGNVLNTMATLAYYRWDWREGNRPLSPGSGVLGAGRTSGPESRSQPGILPRSCPTADSARRRRSNGSNKGVYARVCDAMGDRSGSRRKREAPGCGRPGSALRQ